MTRRIITRNVAVFAGVAVSVLLMTAWFLRPLPYEHALKMREWEPVKDEVEVLVIGSSHSGGAIIPRQFEAMTGRRLFSYCISSLRGFEAYNAATDLLQSQPRNLRVVLIELDDWRPGPSAGVAGAPVTDRELYWHTPTITAAAIDHAPPFATWHLLAMARRINTPWRQSAEPAHAFVYRDGWMPRIVGVDDVTDPRAQFLAQGSKVLRQTPREPSLYAPLLSDLCEAIRDAGAEPVLFAPPTGRSLIPPSDLPARFVSFDSDEYPELFDPENRWDQTHLNAKGAAIFTGEILRELRRFFPRHES